MRRYLWAGTYIRHVLTHADYDRGLCRAHIGKLARYFPVTPDTFVF